MSNYQSGFTGAQIDAAVGGSVRFDVAQSKTEEEKAQAQSNIGMPNVVSDVETIKEDLYSEVSGYEERSWSVIGSKYAEYTATANTASDNISIGQNANYDTYWVLIEEETKVYIDATGITYYALCVGPDATGTWYAGASNTYLYDCEDPYRVRKSDHNLPTIDSPLSISAGTLLVATVTKDTSPKIYFYSHTEGLSIDRVKVTKGSTSYVLKGNNYTVKFEKVDTTQGYQWNITSLYGLSGSNMLPTGTDIVGVIRLDGESNFMGGVHGNESNYEFRLLSNGDDVETGIYAEIHIIMNSHLYNPDSTSSNVVDRFVEFVFSAKGWTCRNSFKVLNNATVTAAYCSGLFAFKVDDCDGAYTNVGSVNLESTSSRQLENTSFREVTINLPSDFTVNLKSDTNDTGWVTYRDATQSFKIYFANAQNEAVTANTVITGKCEYIF